MAYIGEIGKRLKVTVTYKKSFEYVDYKFNYYGTRHFIHTFEDADGNTIVWKSTNMVETINDGKENPNRKGDVDFIPTDSIVELTGTVKDYSEYKGIEQTVFTRCKFKLVEKAKTKAELEQEKCEDQIASLQEGDRIWKAMPYKQYKEHYADCETVAGSFRYEHGKAYIDVIIRDGRLKASGVRGKHYYGFEFTTDDGKKVCYRAICEDNARKRMKKEYPESENWECTKVYDYRDYYIY